MKLRGNLAFPYPVLSRFTDDYIESAFKAEITPVGEPKKEPKSWKIHFSLNEARLLNLVKEQHVQYAIEIICSTTCYRHIEKSFDDNLSVSIPNGALQGRVEMNALLICARPKTGFRSANFNQEYGQEFSFNMQQGYVLAIDTSWYYFDFSRIQPLGSVFVLRGDGNATKDGFSVDLSDEKIAIVLHPDDMDRFQKMRKQQNLREVVLAGVYLPVLIHVLREMVEDSEEDTDKKWHRTIRHQLESQKVPKLKMDNCLEVAQQLLKSPFGKLTTAPFIELLNG